MMQKLFYYIVIILLLINSRIYGQINHKVSFSEGYSIKKVERSNGNSYFHIDMHGMITTDTLGYPALPVKFINLLIPANSKATGITVNQTEKQTINLDYRIEPVQYPEQTGDDDQSHGFVDPDKDKYNSEALYPSTQATIVEENFFRGNRIITVAVYPFRYSPAKNELEVATSIDFTLNYSKGESNNENQVAIDESSLAGKVLKYIVDNKEDVKTYGVQHKKESSTQLKKSKSTQSLKSIQTTNGISVSANYVIVTSAALAPYFNDFMNWKRRKGIDVELVTIDSIYAHYTGDLVSGISDNAGKVRQFLNDAYNDGDGIDYALLAGDNTIVPIRIGYAGNNATFNNFIVPTDLYFGELNSDWKKDDDDRYGEIVDSIDFSQEIFVGRIMVTTTDEVKNWTKKVKIYESNPGCGDPSYVTKAFFTEADDMQREGQAQYVLSRMSWVGADTTVFREQGGYNTSTTPAFPTGNDVITEFNNHYGFCSFMAHGSPRNVAVSTKLTNEDCSSCKHFVTGLDNGPENNNYGITESGNGFDNMTNSDYPSIYYSLSCTTMPLDDFDYVSSSSERNMGECYTCISNGGGPAYLGNTRAGWVSYSHILFGKFNDVIDSSIFNIGIAEAISKFNIGTSNSQTRQQNFSHNLLGCPETELWTATPTTYSPFIQRNDSSITVCSGVSGSKICVMSALDNGSSYFEVEDNVSCPTFISLPKYYYVTITKHNKIPYQLNPTNVLIENKTFSSYTYLNCQTVSAGYSVDPNHTPDGNVVIANGASVTFDATGTITLDKGFSVQLGATFLAK